MTFPAIYFHMKAYEAFCEKSIFDKNRDFGDFGDFMMIQEIARKMAGDDQNAFICAKICSLDHKTYSTYISCHIMIINRKKIRNQKNLFSSILQN